MPGRRTRKLGMRRRPGRQDWFPSTATRFCRSPTAAPDGSPSRPRVIPDSGRAVPRTLNPAVPDRRATMGWASRVLLVALLLLALAEAQKQADAQASGGKSEPSTAAEPSSGGKAARARRRSKARRLASSKADTATEATPSGSTEASTRKSRKSSSSTEATPSSATEASSTQKSAISRRRKSRKNGSTEATPVETSTEASTRKARRNRKGGTTEAPPVETSTEATKRAPRRRNRKGSTTAAPPPEPSTEAPTRKSLRKRKGTTEAPPPETSTPSSRRKNRRKNTTTTTQAPPPSTTARCNKACRRRLKAARRRTTTEVPTTTTTTATTTTTTTTPPPPPRTPRPLDAATVAHLVSSNPALHVLNERILLTASYAYSDDNEVVCNFCLLQLLAAAHTMGNELVRHEIETALQSPEPGQLGEALLQLVSGAPTLSGTFAGCYQTGAVPTCEAQPAWRRDDRCYAIEQFVNLRGTEVDFTRSETTSLINTLVERATGSMIQELFPPLPVSSQLVFASVLVFRDTWRQRLYWQPGSFTTFYGNLSAETLVHQDYVPLLDGSTDGVIGVSLPYSMPGVRMMLFTTGDGSSVVERLRTVHYRALAGAPSTYTTVFFPRFTVYSKKYSYADLVQQMGISEMFRGGLGLGNRLRMEFFVQKAVVSADVDGSDSLTPAPEPVWDGAQHPLPQQVVFDRPFVCSLVHSELDVPFFTAIIRDPTRFY